MRLLIQQNPCLSNFVFSSDMVLIIEDQTYTQTCTLDHLTRHSNLIDRSVQFAQSNELTQTNDEIHRTIYVSQREFAVLTGNDPHGFHLLGSDDATTCHILVLDNHSAVALAHLDGCETEASIEKMLEQLKVFPHEEKKNNYDVYLVGGFLDQSDREYSRKLSNEVLQIFTKMSEEIFHLQLAAITNYNDHLIDGIHYPLIYGICFDIHSKSIRKMSFIDHGPGIRLRMICHSITQHPCHCLYSSSQGDIHLPRFHIEGNLVDRYFRPLHRYYFNKDKELLRLTSTSPEQERATYLNNMKKTILFVLTYHQQLPQWFDSSTNSIVFYRFDQQWKTNNPHVIEDIQFGT